MYFANNTVFCNCTVSSVYCILFVCLYFSLFVFLLPLVVNKDVQRCLLNEVNCVTVKFSQGLKQLMTTTFV